MAIVRPLVYDNTTKAMRQFRNDDVLIGAGSSSGGSSSSGGVPATFTVIDNELHVEYLSIFEPSLVDGELTVYIP
jgi:hypothetical protein